MNCSNTFTLPQKIKVQISIFYVAPSVNGLTLVKTAYGCDAGLQKQILGDRVVIKLKFTNIIGTSAYRAHILGDNLDINWINKWEGRRAIVSVNWKFGNQKIKDHTNDNGTSSQEEKSRIKSAT